MSDPKTNKRIKSYKYRSWVIPGWFTLTDHELFVAINAIQKKFSISGNLLEIGAFCGKSGVLLSLMASSEETVSLLDLFGYVENEEIMDTSDYKKMTLHKARKTLDKYGDRYNLIVGNSLEITKLIPVSPHRLIHIDGSHQYEVVKKDLLNSLGYLANGGIIVLDDYRNFRYPGVAQAFWEFVEDHKMHLVCATPTKAYITKSVLSYAYKEELKKLADSIVPLKILSGSENGFDLVCLHPRKRTLQKFLSAASQVKLKFAPIQVAQNHQIRDSQSKSNTR